MLFSGLGHSNPSEALLEEVELDAVKHLTNFLDNLYWFTEAKAGVAVG